MAGDKNLSISDFVHRHPAPFFNLGTEPWIPVLRDGEVQYVGFVTLLQTAHLIDDLAVADPIEYFSLMRYLIAVTYLIEFYAGPEGLEEVMSGEPFPDKSLEAVVDRLSPRWWLFHPESPFLQESTLPEVMSKKATDKDSLETVAMSYETLAPYRPAKSNESWWYRANGQGLSFPEAALVLLSRHFAAIPGNEAGVLGKDKTRCEGGLMMSGPVEVTSLFWKGLSLARTLVANLVAEISESTTVESVLFVEDPLRVAEHVNEPLYQFCATGGTAFLVWPGEEGRVQRVLRAPLPVSETAAKSLMVAARLSDPHVLRIKAAPGSPDDNNPNKGILSFSGTASQFENVYELYRKSALGREGLRDSILKERATTYRLRLSDYSLCGTTIEGGGTYTGVRINAVTTVLIEPQPLLLDPARSRVLAQLLGKLAGSSNSCTSLLTHYTTTALGTTSSSSLGSALRSNARTHLWAALDESINRLYKLVLETSNTDSLADLPKDIKAEWIEETLRIFDSIVDPYMNTSSIQSRVFESRVGLGKALWKKL